MELLKEKRNLIDHQFRKVNEVMKSPVAKEEPTKLVDTSIGIKRDQSSSLLSTSSVEFIRSKGAFKIPMFSPVGSVH